jgi:uncharacterized membrane protein YgcG
LLRQQRIELHRVISDSNEDVAAQALREFERRRVGQRNGNGQGFPLLINLKSRQARLEVARSLEGVFPGLVVAQIQTEQMAPFF